MKRRRTIYFNDARHYYLFVHEPPMRLEDAWGPVDEVAGTGIDTLVYGVSRDDGLFYPSRIGKRFGDGEPLTMAAYWRVWHNMQSLIDRGLDPLTVLIERAHEQGMEFIASQRMGAFPGAGENVAPHDGGQGMADEAVRDHQFGVLRELALDYPTDGIELDFAAAPIGTDWWVPAADLQRHAPMMTDFMRRVRTMTHEKSGPPALIGARVYPTPELNAAAGLEVETWIEEGLIDYVVPLVYGYMTLDPNMPIQWLVDAAADTETSIYAMLQPYYCEENRPLTQRIYASAAMYRAAASNALKMGVDGLYAWFMHWPLESAERAILTELAHPEQLARKDRHYVLRRAVEATGDHDYPAQLPLAFDPASDLGQPRQITFTIAERLADEPNATSVNLRLAFTDLVAADRLALSLNGQSLADTRLRRWPMREIDPYSGQWVELDLRAMPPTCGENVLEVTLLERPSDLPGTLILEDVELLIGYDTYTDTPLG
jgi:hypothetical protein